ncbi:hypothetical protein SARC_12334 [Sphaeroforma arctica JP610]|uniref:NADH-ubiquinone reductase complex 1 MLRQ subunit n=1 Tax=Sphaeroforma arctica JP610 TaxID=667725 RepID=A0A0L0FEE6_9EUKA|nr:hypothetical protein SARC_12334 [Sphaeroforma arctica JP610]KNC75132.1 hypothetical protein SARC_12334 [Sphaeroforma arctica JP610]|eukprot:XP_014149034.1 hypothetical protein SARC_12334 [Sphaeroforma arctica JP610]
MNNLGKATKFLKDTPELIPLAVPVGLAIGFAGFTIVRNLMTNAALTVNSRPFDKEHSKLLQAPTPTLGGHSPNDTK